LLVVCVSAILFVRRGYREAGRRFSAGEAGSSIGGGVVVGEASPGGEAGHWAPVFWGLKGKGVGWLREALGRGSPRGEGS